MLLSVTGCGSPPIVSGDTYCERARHISADDAQIKVYEANWDVMESYADQIVAHNIEYDKNCTKADGK